MTTNYFYENLLRYSNTIHSKEDIERTIIEMYNKGFSLQDLKMKVKQSIVIKASTIHRKLSIDPKETQVWDITEILLALIRMHNQCSIKIPYEEIARRSIPYGTLATLEDLNKTLFLPPYLIGKEVVIRELVTSTSPGILEEESYRVRIDNNKRGYIILGKFIKVKKMRKEIRRDYIDFPFI